MRTSINILFAFAIMAFGGNANAQLMSTPADFSVTPTAIGGAQVSGNVPDHASLTINLGASPAPSAPQQPAAPSAPASACSNDSCAAGNVASDSCATPWCTLLQIAGVIAAIGAYLLEILLVFAVLAGVWYLMRRLRERRRDRAWHHRNAFLAGRYREALVAGGALDDGDPGHVVWARRAERRYAQLLGHNEQDGRPTAAADLPVPPPLTGVDEDANA